MDEFESIRIIALRNVLKSDGDYVLRKIFRSYSKTFSTPLHLVETLPLEDVFLAYFEDLFESMEAKELENERLDITETDEELKARQKEEDALDAEAFEVAKDIAKEEQADLATVKLPKESGAMAAIRGLTKEVNLINDTFNEIRPEEGISMVFDDSLDDSDFERDSFGILEDRNKP